MKHSSSGVGYRHCAAISQSRTASEGEISGRNGCASREGVCPVDGERSTPGLEKSSSSREHARIGRGGGLAHREPLGARDHDASAKAATPAQVANCFRSIHTQFRTGRICHHNRTRIGNCRATLESQSASVNRGCAGVGIIACQGGCASGQCEGIPRTRDTTRGRLIPCAAGHGDVRPAQRAVQIQRSSREGRSTGVGIIACQGDSGTGDRQRCSGARD